jgi:hypothetical protein
MALTVQIGGANYSIAPFTASTVLTRQAPLLSVLAGAQTAPTGTLSLAWLQSPDDAPPMPDGPIVGVSNTTQTSIAKGVLVVPGAGTQFLALAPLNASIRSIWFFFYGGTFPVRGVGLAPSVSITINGTQFGIILQNVFDSGINESGIYNGLLYRAFIPVPNSTTPNLIFNSQAAGSILYGYDTAPSDTFVYNNAYTPLFIAGAQGSPGGASFASLDTVPYGGATQARLVGVATGNLLTTPVAGTSYRIHSIAMLPDGTNPAGTQHLFCAGSSTNDVFANLIQGVKHSDTLGGLLITTLLYVTNTTGGANTYTVNYDVVTTPTII